VPPSETSLLPRPTCKQLRWHVTEPRLSSRRHMKCHEPDTGISTCLSAADVLHSSRRKGDPKPLRAGFSSRLAEIAPQSKDGHVKTVIFLLTVHVASSYQSNSPNDRLWFIAVGLAWCDSLYSPHHVITRRYRSSTLMRAAMLRPRHLVLLDSLFRRSLLLTAHSFPYLVVLAPFPIFPFVLHNTNHSLLIVLPHLSSPFLKMSQQHVSKATYAGSCVH
jgi:hypothetical protein